MSKSEKSASSVQRIRRHHKEQSRKVTVTIWPNGQNDTRKPKQMLMTVSELTNWIAEQHAPQKAREKVNGKWIRGLPFLKLGEFGDERNPNPNGKIGSYRWNGNMLTTNGPEGDYDIGEIGFEEAKAIHREAGVFVILYRSPSHGVKGDRWRALYITSKLYPANDRRRFLARANGIIGGKFDPMSFTMSQGMYAGSVDDVEGQPGHPIEVVVIEGTPIDLRDDLDEGAIDKPGRVLNPGHEGSKFDEKAALEQIKSGEVIHPNMLSLVGFWSKRNVPYLEVDRRLRAALDAVPRGERDDRWKARVSEIPIILTAIYGKRVAERIAEVEALAELDNLPDDETSEYLGKVPATVRSKEREIADGQSMWGDVWCGARHADRYRGLRLYVSATRQTLAWNGQRWIAQTSEEVKADGKDTSAALLLQSAEAFRKDPSPENRASHQKAMRLHGSSAAIDRMIDLAWSEPAMHVADPSIFDADPASLTCANGVLDLRTGALRPAKPDDLLSKLAAVEYDREAQAPMFKRFLETVQPDQETRAFMQRVAGYMTTGFVDEERFFLSFGTGQNGKSIFANVVAAVLGDYAASLPAALVTRNRHENEAERAKTRLPGVRLALVDETGPGDVFDSGRVKSLASRERIAARKLYAEGFDFMPTHKLFIRTNHLPGSLDASDGFWRRCTPIPFTVQIAEKDRIADLDKRIIAEELPGVLAWLVEGAMAWFQNGLQIPEAIRRETDGYREETDLLGQWLIERTRADEGGKTPVANAFSDYKLFCEDRGASAGTQMLFSRQMTARGMKRSADTSVRQFSGFRLREWFYEDELDDEARALI